jgi:hypothetical protein
MFDYQMSLDYWAGKLNCELRQETEDTPGMMYVEFGYVEGPMLSDNKSLWYPNNQSRYLTCMHELGHFALYHTQGRPPRTKQQFYFENGVLLSEAQAWEWTMNNRVEEELEDDTRRFMWKTCLGSYYNAAVLSGFSPGQTLGNGDRHYVSFSYDKPTDIFWNVKERMLNES